MMSPNKREHIIERYLSGKMSPGELRELHTLAASDPELRRALRVEDSIGRALAADRSAIPAEDPQMRAQLVAALGSLGPVGAAGGAATAPAAGFLAAGMTKILVVGMTALGIGGGIFYLPEMLADRPEAKSVQQERPAIVAPSPAPVASTPQPLPSEASQPPVVPNQPKPVQAEPKQPATVATKQETPAVAEKSEHANSELAQTKRYDSAAASKPLIITNDSVRVKVNVNLDGLK